MGLFGKSSFALPLAMREVPGKCGRRELLETPVHKDGKGSSQKIRVEALSSSIVE
jgi:hypothetical protein